MGSRKRNPALRPTGQNGLQSVRELHAKLVDAETKRRSGKLNEAEKICRALLNVHPTYLGALQTFGLICLAKENYRQAITCFLTAAAEAPSDFTNYINLGVAWIGLEVPQMAALMLREARKLKPDDAEVHFMLGEVFAGDRNYPDAVESYRKALALDKDHRKTLLRLGDCLIDMGNFDEARDLLVHLHDLRPDSIAVVNLLFQLPAGMVDMDFVDAVARTKAQESETQQEYDTNKAFVQAAILDRQGQSAEAWQALSAANASMHKKHAGHLPLMQQDNQQALDMARAMPGATVALRRKTVADTRTPLFILGPSRSGKTTLEKLVCAHPDVTQGFENQLAEFAANRASQTSGLIKMQTVQELPDPLLPVFAEFFRNKLVEKSGEAKVLTTTNPGLITSVCKLAEALPEARFVFLTRNPDDLALRIFMKNYKRGNQYAYHLPIVRQYIAWYADMTEVLTDRLQDQAIRLTYETVVSDPVSSTGRVFQLCNLDPFVVQTTTLISDVGAARPYVQMM